MSTRIISCPTCEHGDAFDPDNEFVEGDGFVCKYCHSNVFYDDLVTAE